MKIPINKLKGYENIRSSWYVDTERGVLVGKRGIVRGSWSRDRKYPYKQVTLRTKDGRKIHKRLDRIIALACVPGKTKDRNQVDHINGKHDDDRPENLRWVTPQENADNRALRRLRGGAKVERAYDGEQIMMAL